MNELPIEAEDYELMIDAMLSELEQDFRQQRDLGDVGESITGIIRRGQLIDDGYFIDD